MSKLISILVFIHITISFYGQNNLKGTVIDVGTRKVVSDAAVKATNSNKSTYTDNYGYFDFDLFIDNNRENYIDNRSYYISNNTLFWDLNNDVIIKLYSLSGSIYFTKNSNSLGSIKLPVPPFGYYFLDIISKKERVKFILFSNGIELNIKQKNNLSSPKYQLDSSIIFSKSNYYDRQITVDSTNDSFIINLLKNEYSVLNYFNELIQYEAFEMIQSSPPVTNYGEIESIKILYDFVNDTIYYINTNIFKSHFSFAKKFLGWEYDNTIFFKSQYGDNPGRFLNLATINYHKSIDKYVFEFGSYDQIDCEGIVATYKKILATSYLKGKLYFYANNLKWADCTEIPTISSEELFLGQNYQALNLQKNYGYLRKIETINLPSSYLGRHDIILLNGIPNDLSVVAGIITTEFQTPLSHINILSHNRKTPNMALRDGWNNPKLSSLIGKLVYLEVKSDSFSIRSASIEEATKFWEKREPKDSIILEKDILTSGLIELKNADISMIKTIGGKAANFAELVNLGSVPVPENYFAIPFYYYYNHLKKHGIDSVINRILKEDKFYSNLEYRTRKLKTIRDLIKESPIDKKLLSLVNNQIHNFNEFPSFRFRSSTNAEDLENFSGAGLYDSKSAKRMNTKKTVEKAIKKVWASLWNLRAFDEREYYKIDHRSTAMGILVHRSFPDEDANGVIITKNIYNVNHAFTINVQYKEYSIVYPEPNILNDQILIYTISLDNSKYTIEYLTHSNVPELDGNTVMTDKELYEIAKYCTKIKNHYFFNLPNNCSCNYNDFAVDIEFKVDSQVENRKIYVKQARIYNIN